MVIAIDGPGGVGKSTVSHLVAAALGLPHLDTGSTYRAAGLLALRSGAAPEDEDAVVAALRNAEIDIAEGVVSVDGDDVTEELRGEDVTAASSTVATHPEVRASVVELQKAWVRTHGGSAVVEGRDIGTVVFPYAPVKIYLTAHADVRADRRLGDVGGEQEARARIADALAERDHADSTRATSPLRPADDAVIIDTSHLSITEVVDRILGLVEQVEARRQRPV